MASSGWFFIDGWTGQQQITETSTTQNHPIGTTVQARHDTYGVATFIYLKGVASTAAYNVVVFNEYANTTTRAVAGSRGPAAVAMSANVANQYGWYMIEGSAIITCGTVSANAPLYATATAGTVDDAVVSGDMILGMVSKTANGTPAAGQLVAQIARPCMSGLG